MQLYVPLPSDLRKAVERANGVKDSILMVVMGPYSLLGDGWTLIWGWGHTPPERTGLPFGSTAGPGPKVS